MNHAEIDEIVLNIRKMHKEMRQAILKSRKEHSVSGALVASEEEEDTIYSIDRTSEEALLELAEKYLGNKRKVTIIAEGIEKRVIGSGSGEPLRIIFDPIDGTRTFIYDKRPAWILTGVAEDYGDKTNLTHIFLAVMTEIPITKQWRADQFWAVKGKGAFGIGEDVTGIKKEIKLSPSPSKAKDLNHCFAQISRFFPGTKVEVSEIEEELFKKLLSDTAWGRGNVFEDQYTSTGGQIYELISGKDRFIADIRSLFIKKWEGKSKLLCSHPYDICTELIAREAGVIIEKPDGGVLDYPLNTKEDISWCGYANKFIYELVAPLFKEILKKKGLI